MKKIKDYADFLNKSVPYSNEFKDYGKNYKKRFK